MGLELKQGQVLANYPEVCEVLGVKPTKGNAMKTHVAMLGRYCKYTRHGHKYIILEVYETPLPKPTRKDSIWIDQVSLGVMKTAWEYIVEEEKPTRGEVISYAYMKKYELAIACGLCNKNYYIDRRSTILASEEEEQDARMAALTLEFYDISNSKISNILSTVYKSLYRKYGVVIKQVYLCKIVGGETYEASHIIESRIAAMKINVLAAINKDNSVFLDLRTIYISPYRGKFIQKLNRELRAELGIVELATTIKVLLPKRKWKQVVTGIEASILPGTDTISQKIVLYMASKMKERIGYAVVGVLKGVTDGGIPKEEIQSSLEDRADSLIEENLA